MAAPYEKTKYPGIYKRGSRYVVDLRAEDGRRLRRSAGTLAEARTLLASLRTDNARGELHNVSKVRFDDYARQWIDTYTGRTSKGVREQTVVDYRRALEKRAIPFFGRRPLAQIQLRDVKQYVHSVQAEGLQPDTVRLSVAPVRALFATALEEGLIRSNPCAGLRLPTRRASVGADEPETKALDEDELARLIAEVPDPWQLLVRFLVATGLRMSEAVALQWRDLDLAAGKLSVRRGYHKGRLAPPKSRYAQRTVGLPAKLAKLLKEHKLASPYSGKTDPVFASTHGTMLDATNLLNRVVKPAAARAGVPWAGLHTLRHTCASMLFRNGWNAKQVQLMLGHHSPAFTLDTYVHLLPDDLPALEFMDELAEPSRVSSGKLETAQ